MNDSEQILEDLINKFAGYCYCDEYHIHGGKVANADPNDGHMDFDEDRLKATILQHYISKEEVERAIGDDEKIVEVIDLGPGMSYSDSQSYSYGLARGKAVFKPVYMYYGEMSTIPYRGDMKWAKRIAKHYDIAVPPKKGNSK